MSNYELNINPDSDFDDILTNPILDIAARVWDGDKYDAFKLCYRSMRKIDDLVDNLKISFKNVPEIIGRKISEEFNKWLGKVRTEDSQDRFVREFIEIKNRFKIPLWPWERLCKAMKYDLFNSGFRSFMVFLRYAEGAAIAPAAVFMHLCFHGNKNCDNLNIRKYSRDLAIFSYLVHIIRDFRKDQIENLNYIPGDLMERYALKEAHLKTAAVKGENIGQFTTMIEHYREIAGYYQKRARVALDSIVPSLTPKYRLSLEIIYGLYSQIFNKGPEFSGYDINLNMQPSAEEVKAELKEIVAFQS